VPKDCSCRSSRFGATGQLEIYFSGGEIFGNFFTEWSKLHAGITCGYPDNDWAGVAGVAGVACAQVWLQL
jgi:hypothetical protein